ncbi:MAG: carboxylesterase [Planctomycetaceae bacterium]|nr:carboxylesterase [Planctomycetaceae bacterium]|tara:strand:- start:1010 stop:2134 length:1125 start_codon:yes stop_codon:yes gene_type:complete
MSTLLRSGCLLLVILGLPGVVAAEDRAAALFRKWDRNNDGKLTRQELPTAARRNFSRVDRDRNGFISLKEHTAFLRGGSPKLPAGVRLVADQDYVGDRNPRHRLDLLLPEKPVGHKPLPVVAYVHGGGWRGGDKSSGLPRVAGLVASGRYVGVSIGYRLTGEASWPAQIHDCKAAIRWLKAHAKNYRFDPDRIAVFGSSAGGHLVSMLGVSGGVEDLRGRLGPHGKFDSRVAAVVDFFGPTDFLKMNDQPGKIDHNAARSPESLLVGGAIQEHVDRCRHASPLTYVDSRDAPFLIVHGDRDDVVIFPQSQLLQAALKKAAVPVALVTVKGGGHGVRGRAVEARVREFLEFHLYGRGSLPSDQVLTRTSRRRQPR